MSKSRAIQSAADPRQMVQFSGLIPADAGRVMTGKFRWSEVPWRLLPRRTVAPPMPVNGRITRLPFGPPIVPGAVAFSVFCSVHNPAPAISFRQLNA